MEHEFNEKEEELKIILMKNEIKELKEQNQIEQTRIFFKNMIQELNLLYIETNKILEAEKYNNEILTDGVNIQTKNFHEEYVNTDFFQTIKILEKEIINLNENLNFDQDFIEIDSFLNKIYYPEEGKFYPISDSIFYNNEYDISKGERITAKRDRLIVLDNKTQQEDITREAILRGYRPLVIPSEKNPYIHYKDINITYKEININFKFVLGYYEIDWDTKDDLISDISKALRIFEGLINTNSVSIMLVGPYPENITKTVFGKFGNAIRLINDAIIEKLKSDYSGETFAIQAFRICYFEDSYRGRKKDAEAILNDTFFVINPTTRINCLFVAIAIGLEWHKCPDMLSLKETQNRRGFALKQRAGIPTNQNDLYNNSTIVQIANRLNIEIILYNKLFEPIIHVKPKNGVFKNTVKLLRDSYHILTLIEKEDIKHILGDTFYKDFSKSVNEYSLSELLKKDKEIDASDIMKYILNPEKSCKKIFNYSEKEPQIKSNVIIIDLECSAKYEEEFTLDTKISKENKKDNFPVPEDLGHHKSWAGGICFKEILNSTSPHPPETVKYEIPTGNNEFVDVRYKSWFGENICNSILDYLADNIEYFDGHTICGHNAGKYDLPIILREALILHSKKRKIEGKLGFKINNKGCKDAGRCWISFQIYIYDKKINKTYNLFFRDTLKWLPLSLETLTYDFDTKYKKLKDAVKHYQINLNNYHEDRENREKYLRNDCLGLIEIVLTYIKQIFNETKINMLDCSTSTSFTKKNYYNNYSQYNKPIYVMNKFFEVYIRNSYKGARLECFFIGHIKKPIRYLDFTSLYPSSGTLTMPYNLPIFREYDYIELTEKFINSFKDSYEWEYTFTKKSKIEGEPDQEITKKEHLDYKFYGFFIVEVLGTEEMLKNKGCFTPIHGYEINDLYCFPYIEKPTLMCLFSSEIRKGLKYGYTYKLKSGVLFQSSQFLSNFFKNGFNKKSSCKKQGLFGLANGYKLNINGMYGAFAFKFLDRESVIIDKDNNLGHYLESEQVVDWEIIANKLFLRVIQDVPNKDCNVAIASAITSYSRLRLWEVINHIKSNGYEVYACDTDSIFTDYDYTANNAHAKEFRKLYISDYDIEKGSYGGEELGSLKNELLDKLEKHYLKKLNKPYLKIFEDANNEYTKEYKQNIKNDIKNKVKDLIKSEIKRNPTLAFDELIVIDNKKYYLSYCDAEGDLLEVAAFSGYSQKDLSYTDRTGNIYDNNCKLTKKDYVDLLNKIKLPENKRSHYSTFKEYYQRRKEVGLHQTQVRFGVASNNYINVDDFAKVKNTKVDKYFLPEYKKGIVDKDGWVQPFIVKNQS